MCCRGHREILVQVYGMVILWKNRYKVLPIQFFREFLPAFGVTILNIGLHLIGTGFAADLLALYYPIAFVAYLRGLVYDVVQFKKQRMKIYNKINGMHEASVYGGFSVFGYVKCLIMSLILFSGLYLTGLLNPKSFGLTYLTFTFTGFATSHLSLALSSLFDSPTMAADIGGTIVAMTGLMYFLVINSDSLMLYYFASLLPHTAMLLGTFANEPGGLSSGVDFKTTDALLMMVVDMVIYYVIYLYLDQVIPGEFGMNKHPLLCLKRKKKQSQVTSPPASYVHSTQTTGKNRINIPGDVRTPLMNEPEYNLTLVEDVSMDSANNRSQMSPTKYFEKTESIGQPLLEFENVCKSFKGKKVLNNVGLALHAKQIVCLLGKNGAGKTTTIGTISGFLRKDSGTIKYWGTEFTDNYELFQKKLGLCTQLDIVFPFMTVREHLMFLARVKGIAIGTRAEKINAVAEECGITKVLDKRIATLSIGIRRLFWIAMTLLGDPAIILLDEPTTSLDPDNRKRIWALLKKLRNEGKAILVTSQDMIEAQELADRIAILIKGTLYAAGSFEYIQKKFGVGYKIRINPKPGIKLMNEWREIAMQVQNIVQPKASFSLSAKSDSIVERMLEFNLEMKSSRMIEVLSELENIKQIDVSVHVTTLEDIFVKIGIEDEKFLGMQYEDMSSVISSFAKSTLPKAQPPKYSFWLQLWAMFRRKYLHYRRNKFAPLSNLLPLVFVTIGAALRNPADPQGSGLTFMFDLLFGLALNSSIACGFPVQEREDNVKFTLFAMGARMLPYWLGTFLFDFLNYLVLILLISGIIVIFFAGITLRFYGEFILLSVCFISGFVLLAYLYGYVFNRGASAYKAYPMVALFFAYAIPICLIDICDYKNILWLGYMVKAAAFITTPAIPYQEGFAMFLYNGQLPAGRIPLFPSGFYYIIYLFVQALVYLGLVLYIELRNQKPKQHLYKPDMQKSLAISALRSGRRPQGHNSTFNDTRFSIDLETAGIPDLVTVENATLVHANGLSAISGLEFGVLTGEIFGLLGPSGSGKSTIINVITGKSGLTEGRVKILNKKSDKDFLKKEIGICPQIDSLWTYATVREHLEIYGRIKGLDTFSLKQEIDLLVEALGLGDIMDKRSSSLALGDKRKLSVGIASMCCPLLQIYDEPSIGMDPIAKRKFWRYMMALKSRRPCAIIISTHLLHEAETICNRIGVLINGVMEEMGSVNILRAKYTSGYTLAVKRSNTCSKKEFKALLNLGGIKFERDKISDTPEHEKYMIADANFKLSKGFALLSHLQNEGKLVEYAIYKNSFSTAYREICHSQHNYQNPEMQRF